MGLKYHNPFKFIIFPDIWTQNVNIMFDQYREVYDDQVFSQTL